MEWTTDDHILLTLSNDSTYTYKASELYHTRPVFMASSSQEFTYLPVAFSEEFASKLKESIAKEEQYRESANKINASVSKKTLWSALNASIGGGWEHFINCLLYSLETGYLELNSEALKRPETDWKPEEMSESYRRTRKWDYYVPVERREAKKEYRKKTKNEEQADLAYLPESFIQLFLSSSPGEQEKMLKNGNTEDLAKIKLVKILLGATYLGKEQIEYIRNKVLSAVESYPANQMPTVIIIEEYQAAVAMTLDKDGYRAEKIVLKNQHQLTDSQVEDLKDAVNEKIREINQANRENFKRFLDVYYEK